MRSAPGRSISVAAKVSRQDRCMATADLTVIGLGRADPSAGEYIAEIQRRLESQRLVTFKLHAMGTSLEGSTDDILTVVADLHRVPFEMGLPRVYTILKIDERRDKPQTLDDKVRSVEERLERPAQQPPQQEQSFEQQPPQPPPSRWRTS
jgi:uncharacterized protein (TIGR00106 family)